MLVIEDDAAIGENLVELLESEGHRVCWGHDGVEGLELLGRDHPDVILLDLLMPRMNGFQFRALQKADPDVSWISNRGFWITCFTLSLMTLSDGHSAFWPRSGRDGSLSLARMTRRR